LTLAVNPSPWHATTATVREEEKMKKDVEKGKTFIIETLRLET